MTGESDRVEERARILMVPTGSIVVPEERMYSHMDPDTWEQFKQSIRVQGILQPITVIKRGDKLILVDGYHRLKAALELGIPKVPVVISSTQEEDAYLHNIITNRLRGKTTTADMIRVIKHIQKQYGLSISKIAELTGLSRAYVSKLMKIAKAHPALLEALDQGRLSVDAAVELAKLPDPELQARATATAVALGYGTQDVKRYVAAIFRELEKPPEEQAPVEEVKPIGIRCHFCGREFPPQDVVTVNMCHECYYVAVTALREYYAQLNLPKEGERAEAGAPAAAPEGPDQS